MHTKMVFEKLMKSMAFYVLTALMLVMGSATLLEKSRGSGYAYDHIYGSWWFIMLWALLVVLVCIGLIKGKTYRNPSLFLLHTSFIVMLAGALCTRLFSLQGYVILQNNAPTSILKTDEQLQQLPFSLQLDTFYVELYPGTDSPADYVTHFTITNTAGKSYKEKVSMNNICSHDGYRFYQSSYGQDQQTSVLTVNRDQWGIPLTYSGYALFVLAMLWYLLSPRNAFRQLLGHPLFKAAGICLLLLIPVGTNAQLRTKDSLSVNRSQADQFGRLYMLYEGRITSVSVFARDFSLKLTGKPRFGYLTAEQFLMGLLFFPDRWQRVALFEVNDPALRHDLNSPEGKAAISDFFDQTGRYKLLNYRSSMGPMHARSPLQKELEKLNDKIQLINMLHSGVLMQLFPLRTSVATVQWVQPTQTLPRNTTAGDSIFVRTALTSYYLALSGNSEQHASGILQRIDSFQHSQAGVLLPSAQKRDMEILYLKAGFSSLLFKINLTLGIIALLIVFLPTGSKRPFMERILFYLLVCSLLTQTLSIALRAWIAGHLPLTNGAETMLTIAWCAMLGGLLLRRKFSLMMTFSFLLSGFALLVAHLGMSNPKITPLMPVLSSPLLSIHVSVIMLAYTLLAFVALNSLMTLISLLSARCEAYMQAILLLERNRIFGLLCLYPAILLLGSGIFIGAVWANVSWGRYWSWDPKEVWALITFMLYALSLHRHISCMEHRFWFHVFGLLAFYTVLMTYFGVNYVLGGMHSYAGEMDLTDTWIAVVLSILMLLLLIVFSFRKYKKICV